MTPRVRATLARVSGYGIAVSNLTFLPLAVCGSAVLNESMLTLLIITIGLTAFGLASVRFGTESRPGFDERPDGTRFGALR
jgi:hypothetical protein